jgi:hypothetical protein
MSSKNLPCTRMGFEMMLAKVCSRTFAGTPCLFYRSNQSDTFCTKMCLIWKTTRNYTLVGVVLQVLLCDFVDYSHARCLMSIFLWLLFLLTSLATYVERRDPLRAAGFALAALLTFFFLLGNANYRG